MSNCGEGQVRLNKPEGCAWRRGWTVVGGVRRGFSFGALRIPEKEAGGKKRRKREEVVDDDGDGIETNSSPWRRRIYLFAEPS
jgi:hypothetical protein